MTLKSLAEYTLKTICFCSCVNETDQVQIAVDTAHPGTASLPFILDSCALVLICQ